MSLISVVIPVYNSATTIEETLQSLLAQTWDHWEAIIIDDGSTDHTLEVIASVVGGDPRFVVRSQANAGPSAARNFGAKLARGTWLAFLDADDLWRDDKLAVLAAHIGRKDAADAYFGKISFMSDPSSHDSVFSTVPQGALNLEAVAGENKACTLSNFAISKEAFYYYGGFDTDMVHSEDLEFQLRIVAAGGLIEGIDHWAVRYRANPDGLSADLTKMHDGWEAALKGVRPFMTLRTYQRAEAVHLRYLARRALRMNYAPMVAFRFALRGMMISPAGFLSDRYRGPATLIAALAAPLMPLQLRRFAFVR